MVLITDIETWQLSFIEVLSDQEPAMMVLNLDNSCKRKTKQKKKQVILEILVTQAQKTRILISLMILAPKMKTLESPMILAPKMKTLESPMILVQRTKTNLALIIRVEINFQFLTQIQIKIYLEVFNYCLKLLLRKYPNLQNTTLSTISWHSKAIIHIEELIKYVT
jgi:hypothetical protein